MRSLGQWLGLPRHGSKAFRGTVDGHPTATATQPERLRHVTDCGAVQIWAERGRAWPGFSWAKRSPSPHPRSDRLDDPVAERVERRVALLLAEALPAAVAVDELQAGLMLLRPFPTECVCTRHAPPSRTVRTSAKKIPAAARSHSSVRSCHRSKRRFTIPRA